MDGAGSTVHRLLWNGGRYLEYSQVTGNITLHSNGGNFILDNVGNVGIGTTASTGVKFYVKGNGSTSATYPFMVVNSSGTNILYVNDGGGGYL